MDLGSDVITRLAKIEMALNRIADALTAQALPDEPNFTRDLSAYPGFDWGTIGAEPVEYDDAAGQQATIVRWGMHEWSRKSASNKFGQAIIFSRTVGKDEYLTLIKFRTGGGVDPVAFPVPQAALPAPAQRQAIPAAVDNHAPAMPPRATVNQVAPSPTEQPALFLWEMRRALQADDAEIKRRLKALGVTGFPAAHDVAGYTALKARLTQAQAVR